MSVVTLEPYEPPRRLHPFTLAELLAMELPPRENILAPWLPTKGLAMIFSPRGVGKTHLALAIAYAVATGGALLKWRADKPRRVLVVDGEMPARLLQDRWARIVSQGEVEPAEGFVRIIAADTEPDGIPDLATAEGQEEFAAFIGDAELIIIDSLSTLCRSYRENEADSWGIIQEFALRLRREGRSVLFIHHAGKDGEQRGTSRREDVLDTVIKLRRPADYRARDGARFEVHFTKSRGFAGEEADPFDAALDTCGCWTWREIEDAQDTRIIGLHRDGLNGKEIAEEIGVSGATVSRRIKRLKSQGRLALEDCTIAEAKG